MHSRDHATSPNLPTICLVAELPPPTGGMAIQAAMLSTALRAEGHEVVNVRTNTLALTSPWRRIPVLRSVINFLGYFAALLRGCRRADIVHVFGNSYLSFFLFSMPAVLVAQMLGKKSVLHYHGGAAREFLQRWGWLAIPILRRADRILVPSGFLRRIFDDFGITSAELPNILPLERLAFHPRLPLQPRIIIARHLEHDYNPSCGLRAFAKVRERYPGATMIVAGDGSERAKLTQQCRELGIADSVRFTGNVDTMAMSKLYDQSDVYLNCSRVDNQPVSMLEAFALGLPVVSTDVGGIPYMAAHGETALLAPSDDDRKLADHVIALLQDGPMASRIASSARASAEQFGWRPIYDRLSAIYRGAQSR
jgi:glycosyltransferase involved in cell wall biosynthesis